MSVLPLYPASRLTELDALDFLQWWQNATAQTASWTHTAAYAKVTAAARARVFTVAREGRPQGYLELWTDEEVRAAAALPSLPSGSASGAPVTEPPPAPAAFVSEARALRGGPWVTLALEQAPKVCELERLLQVLHRDSIR